MPNKRHSKKPFFPTAPHKRNLETMKLLISMPEFQAHIQQARKQLDIPAPGLELEQLEEWYSNLYKKSFKLEQSHEFQRKRDLIFKKFKAGELDEAIARKQLYFWGNKIPLNYLQVMLDFLIDKFHLPGHFEDSLRTYILTGEVIAPAQNFTTSAYRGTAMSEPKYLNVKIYEKLTNQEMVYLKKWVNGFLGAALPSYKPLKNIDQKLTLEDWYANRKEQDVLAEKQTRTSAQAIALEILGSKKKAQRVYDAPRELNKARKTRFGKR